MAVLHVTVVVIVIEAFKTSSATADVAGPVAPQPSLPCEAAGVAVSWGLGVLPRGLR